LPCVAGVAPFRRLSTDVGTSVTCGCGSSWLHPQLLPRPLALLEERPMGDDGRTDKRRCECSGASKQTIPSKPCCNKNPAKPFRHSSLDSSNVAQQTPRSHQRQTSNPLASSFVPTARLTTQSGKDTPSCRAQYLVARQKVDRTYSSSSAASARRHPSFLPAFLPS
jgi:hypothetical protein